MTEILDVKKVRLSGGTASDAALPTGAVGEREPRPWAVETPNHTRTLILILLGFSEDTHPHIHMVMAAMTTAGA